MPCSRASMLNAELHEMQMTPLHSAAFVAVPAHGRIAWGTHVGVRQNSNAFPVSVQVFAFTNHTVLPEALEKWPVSLIEKLLPRHMQIIFDINWRFLQQLRSELGDDSERIGRMSIIEDGYGGDK